MLNDPAIVEYLLRASRDERPLPTRTDCYVMSVRLSTPRAVWTSAVADHKWGAGDASHYALALIEQLDEMTASELRDFQDSELAQRLLELLR